MPSASDSTTVGADGVDGVSTTTTKGSTAQDAADELSDELEDAKKTAAQLCGDCVGSDCSTACQMAKEFVGVVEKDFAAASQAADTERTNNAVVVDSAKGNGGKIAGALIGILLLIVLVVLFLTYRQKANAIPTEGELQAGKATGHENPMYDHVGLEGGNTVAVNARMDGSMSNPTYGGLALAEDSVTYDNSEDLVGAGAAGAGGGGGVQKRQQSFKVPMADGSQLVVTQDEDADTYGELPAIPPQHAHSEA